MVPSDRTDAAFAQDCQCNPGYSHRPPDDYKTDTIISENVCYACDAGFYNADLGKMECSPCGPGYFSPMLASLSIDNCDTCAADTFSMAGEKECTNCTADSQAPPISSEPTDCVCNAGYTGVDGGTCVACVAGKIKIQMGSALCTDCLAGQYSTDVAATACSNCLDNSNSPVGSISAGDCICNPAYTLSASLTCDICAQNTFKTEAGNAACTDCTPNSESPAGSSISTDCKCVVGHTSDADGTQCLACVTGKFKTSQVLQHARLVQQIRTHQSLASVWQTVHATQVIRSLTWERVHSVKRESLKL